MLRIISIVTFALIITSCTTNPGAQSNTKKPELEKSEFTQCPEQRPKICTREYIPVCATRDTGVRCVTTPCPSSEQKTYGNGCSACADEMVLGYKLDACTPETPVQ